MAERRKPLIGSPVKDTWAEDTFLAAQRAVNGTKHKDLPIAEQVALRRARRPHWSEPPILFQLEVGPWADASTIGAEDGRGGLKAYCDVLSAEEIRDRRRCGHCGAGWPYPPTKEDYFAWLSSDWRFTPELEQLQRKAIQNGCCPVCFVPADSVAIQAMDDGQENYARDRRGLYDGAAATREREKGPRFPGSVIPVNFGKGRDS